MSHKENRRMRRALARARSFADELRALRIIFEVSPIAAGVLNAVGAAARSGKWKAEHLPNGTPENGPGWYATKMAKGMLSYTRNPFPTEAECVQWTEQKNAEEAASDPATNAGAGDAPGTSTEGDS